MLDALWRDLNHACRGLRRSPAFLYGVTLILVVTVGVATTVFTLLNAIAYRQLPVHNPQELVGFSTTLASGASGNLSMPMFQRLASRQDILSQAVGSWGTTVLTVEANANLSQATVTGVTGNFYDIFPVVPSAGRLIGHVDTTLDSFRAEPVAVLGHTFWQRRFGGRADAIGSLIKVQGVPFTVIGVGPPGFRGFGVLAESDVTLPLPSYPELFRGSPDEYANAGNVLWLKMAARLKPGVTFSQAKQEFDAMWPAIKGEVVPPGHTGERRDSFLAMKLNIESLARGQEVLLRPRFTDPLRLLLWVALIAIALAAFNLAALMLTRIASSQFDTAIREAVGAGRWQARRHILLESLVLGAVGASGGLWIAYVLSRTFVRNVLAGSTVPLSLDVEPDTIIMGFAGAMSFGCICLGSLVANLFGPYRDAAAVLHGRSQGTRARWKIGTVLIIGQVALSVMLLVPAGLLVKNIVALLSADPGYNSRDLLIAYLMPKPGTDTSRNADTYVTSLLQAMAGLPTIESAGIAKVGLARGRFPQQVSLMQVPASEGVPAAFNAVSPGFLESLQLRVISGRAFGSQDLLSSSRSVVISQGLARRLFQEGDPIGQRLRIGTQPDTQDLSIIGVVSDATLYDQKDALAYSVFVPLHGDSLPAGAFAVIRTGSPDQAAIRRLIETSSPYYVASLNRIDDLRHNALAQDRMAALLAVLYGALAICITALGIGGLINYRVKLRLPEMAIRIAVGAPPQRLARAVVLQAVAAAVAGLVLGLALSEAPIGVSRRLISDVTPHDPLINYGVAGLLLGVAVIAATLPARKIVNTDHVRMLKG